MIEQIAYLALLGMPELASEASAAAGTMIEGVGRRFASGVYIEITEKLARDTGLLGGALSKAIEEQMSGALEGIQTAAASVLSNALDGEKASLASVDELRILRKLAADVADGRDVEPALTELKQFYTKQTV